MSSSIRQLRQADLPHRVYRGIVGHAINAVRFLSVDAVERADSGHPRDGDGARPAGMPALPRATFDLLRKRVLLAT